MSFWILDGMISFFYCSPDKAGNALDKMVKSGTAHKGDWSVYMLDETSEDLVKMENGRMILASPARLKTWLEIEGRMNSKMSLSRHLNSLPLLRPWGLPAVLDMSVC